MRNGTYKVIKDIHTFSCEHGHLSIAKGTWVEVDGSKAVAANTVRFPSILLNNVHDCLERLY